MHSEVSFSEDHIHVHISVEEIEIISETLESLYINHNELTGNISEWKWLKVHNETIRSLGIIGFETETFNGEKHKTNPYAYNIKDIEKFKQDLKKIFPNAYIY